MCEAARFEWLSKRRRNGCPVSLPAKRACPGTGMTRRENVECVPLNVTGYIRGVLEVLEDFKR